MGLSRQTVNKVLRSLEGMGIVSLDFGRVAIVDDEALNAYLAAATAAGHPGWSCSTSAARGSLPAPVPPSGPHQR